MNTQTTNVPSMVTLHEAMAGLIWASQTRHTKKVFEDIETELSKTGGATKLFELYRRLDGCTVEDGIDARVLFLDTHFLRPPDPEDKKRIVRNLDVLKAIRELDDLHGKVLDYEDQFHKELDKEKPRIKVSQSPTGVARYYSHSVAIWAREELGITIAEWEDFSKWNLYENGLRKDPWIKRAIQEAHLHLLDALLDVALTAEIQQNNDRIPPKKLRLQFNTNAEANKRGDVNVAGFQEFIEHQFYRITHDAERKLLPRDASRTIIERWGQVSTLSSRQLEPYSTAKERCVKYMIAGLVIGLADDGFAGELRDKGPQKRWQMPKNLDTLDLKCIERVHPDTAKRIFQKCIDNLLKKAFESRGK